MPHVLAGNDDVRAARRLGDHLVDDKGRIGGDDLIAGLDKGADDELDQFVRSVAQDDLVDVHVVFLCKRLGKIKPAAVGVAVQAFQRLLDRRDRLR